MRGSSPRARTGSAWHRVALPVDRAGAVLRSAGFCLSNDDPVEAYGHCDRQGRWRRVHARYADGWRATLVFRLDGSGSLSYSIKMAVRGSSQ
ncbi:MAG: hypothetical protein ACOY45_01695 [Pseudomonadota bacterium]